MVPEEPPPVSKPFWRRLPPATTLLVLVCIGWTVQVPVSGESFRDPAALEAAGAIRPSSLWDGEFQRLITAIFLHGGWIHLLVNVVSLWFVGKVIEQGVGRGAYLLFVFASAFGGVAASLLWNTSEMWRVGISGGVAGLIGLVLALEWGASHSWLGFLKARNTIMVLVVLAINVGIAMYFKTVQGAQIDHAGHIGGFLCGLLGGLAYFPRSRLRPTLGTAVLLLLTVPALGYAAKPVWNPDYYMYRARQARMHDDADAEIAALTRYLELRPLEVPASIRLAMLEDSPAPLEDLAPERAAEANAVASAWLELAARRLDEEPNTARDHAERAAAIVNAAVPQAWLVFGGRAEKAEQKALASLGYRKAYEASQLLGRGVARWRPAWAMLEAVVREAGDSIDNAALLRLLTLAREAAPGLNRSEGESRAALEQRLLAIGTEGIARARAAEGEAERGLALTLSEFFAALASNTAEEDPRIAEFDWHMAVWWWVAAEDKDDPETRSMGAGRFATAWRSARHTKNARIENNAAKWFLDRGIPLPAAELAEPEDGG